MQSQYLPIRHYKNATANKANHCPRKADQWANIVSKREGKVFTNNVTLVTLRVWVACAGTVHTQSMSVILLCPFL